MRRSAALRPAALSRAGRQIRATLFLDNRKIQELETFRNDPKAPWLVNGRRIQEFDVRLRDLENREESPPGPPAS